MLRGVGCLLKANRGFPGLLGDFAESAKSESIMGRSGQANSTGNRRVGNAQIFAGVGCCLLYLILE